MAEFVDEKLCKAFQCAIRERLSGMDASLVQRTADLERRLLGLNELRAEVVKDRELLLKKETYDIKTAGYDTWCAEINRRITVLESKTVWKADLDERLKPLIEGRVSWTASIAMTIMSTLIGVLIVYVVTHKG
jgi:hypothetical protein